MAAQRGRGVAHRGARSRARRRAHERGAAAKDAMQAGECRRCGDAALASPDDASACIQRARRERRRRASRRSTCWLRHCARRRSIWRGSWRSRSTSAPDWSDIEWAIARSVAAMQGISALLAGKLRWPGPPAWQSFLAEQREQCLLRDARIGALLERIDAATRERRVACVALKGAALRALDLYAPGERPMGDVDLLVSELRPAGDRGGDGATSAMSRRSGRNDIACTSRVTRSRRAVSASTSTTRSRSRSTRRRGTAAGAQGRHHRALWPGGARARAERISRPRRAAAALAAPRGRQHAGACAAADPAARHRHGRTAPRDRPIGACCSSRRAVTKERGGCFRRSRSRPATTPSAFRRDVLREARAACPRVLRLATERQSLTDVSWSNLHIHAFPGIAWSRTPLEALRFMRSRALPSRAALAELRSSRRRAQPQLDACLGISFLTVGASCAGCHRSRRVCRRWFR